MPQRFIHEPGYDEFPPTKAPQNPVDDILCRYACRRRLFCQPDKGLIETFSALHLCKNFCRKKQTPAEGRRIKRAGNRLRRSPAAYADKASRCRLIFCGRR